METEREQIQPSRFHVEEEEEAEGTSVMTRKERYRLARS